MESQGSWWSWTSKLKKLQAGLKNETTGYKDEKIKVEGRKDRDLENNVGQELQFGVQTDERWNIEQS